MADADIMPSQATMSINVARKADLTIGGSASGDNASRPVGGTASARTSRYSWLGVACCYERSRAGGDMPNQQMLAGGAATAAAFA